MRRALTSLALALALAVVLGWPTVAAVRAARRAAAPMLGTDAARPLRLAAETIRLVAATEAIALLAGVLLAFWLFRTDLWGRRVWIGLMALSLFVPMPLHALAWLGALGNVGRSQAIGSRPILVGWQGAAVVHALAAIPWVVLLVGVGLRGVEAELEEAALLDLPAWRVVLRLSLRRAIGAIAGAALAVAVLTAGDMTVTDLVMVRTYAEEAYTQFQASGSAAAAAIALPTLAVLGPLVLLAAAWVLHSDPARLASTAARARTWRLGPWRGPLGLV
ncbi:MAG: iron ABC transporter permease, partial [Isosphaeraceae bacterium]|nr:iron ABC transporter permease [Isosphaeraceae bacterium]